MAEEKDNSWKIAGLILAGLMGWHMAGALFDVWMRHRAVKQFNAQLEEVLKPRNDPLGLHTSIAESQRRKEAERRRAEEARRLKPDEHCFDGQRFRRLENGWQQLPNQPC